MSQGDSVHATKTKKPGKGNVVDLAGKEMVRQNDNASPETSSPLKQGSESFTMSPWAVASLLSKEKFSSTEEQPKSAIDAAQAAAAAQELEVSVAPDVDIKSYEDATGQITGPALRRNYGATVYTLSKGRDPPLPKLRLAPGTKVSRERHREGNMGAIYQLTGFHGSLFALKLPKDLHGLLALESELNVCKTFRWEAEPSKYFLPCVGAVVRKNPVSSRIQPSFWANGQSDQPSKQSLLPKKTGKDDFAMVKITSDFAFKQSTLVGLVYPFCKYGTLGEVVRGGIEVPVVDRIADLLHIYKGLRMLHENGITHDDFHADNIMRLDEYGPRRYRIIDFGNSHCNFTEWTDYDANSFEHICKYYLFKDSQGGRFPGQRATWTSSKPKELRSFGEHDAVGFYASKRVWFALTRLMSNFSDFDRGEAILKALLRSFQSNAFKSVGNAPVDESIDAARNGEDDDSVEPIDKVEYYHGDGQKFDARLWRYDNDEDVVVTLTLSCGGLDIISSSGRLLFTVPLHMMPYRNAKEGFKKEVGVLGKYGTERTPGYRFNRLAFPWYSPPQPTEHGLVQGAPPGFGRSQFDTSRLVLFFDNVEPLHELHSELLLWGSRLDNKTLKQLAAKDDDHDQSAHFVINSVTGALAQSMTSIKTWTKLALDKLRSRL